jgi:hypothetical protein
MKAYDVDSARLRLGMWQGYHKKRKAYERMISYLAKILTVVFVIGGWIFFACHLAAWIWKSLEPLL